MNIGAWVKQARTHSGKSQLDLAMDLGCSKGNVSQWENNKHSPSIEQVLEIARLTGLEFPGIAMIERAVGDNPEDRYEFAIRVHGTVLSAGNGGSSWEHEEIDGSHAFTRDWLQRKRLNIDQCRVLTVDGDSMQPELKDGYVVLIDLSDCLPIKSGKVYAICIEGEMRIKRLFRQADGSLRISSDNPDKVRYPDEVVAPQHLDRVKIIGRKRWHAGDDD